jgi:hypothetical protein
MPSAMPQIADSKLCDGGMLGFFHTLERLKVSSLLSRLWCHGQSFGSYKPLAVGCVLIHSDQQENWMGKPSGTQARVDRGSYVQVSHDEYPVSDSAVLCISEC